MLYRAPFYAAVLAKIAHKARTAREIGQLLCVRPDQIAAVLRRFRGRIAHIESYDAGGQGFPAARWRMGCAPDAPAPAINARANRLTAPARGWPNLAAFIVLIEGLLDDEPRCVTDLVLSSGCSRKTVGLVLRFGRAKNFMRIAEWDRDSVRQPWVAHWTIGIGEDKPKPVSDRLAMDAARRRLQRARKKQARTPFVPVPLPSRDQGASL